MNRGYLGPTIRKGTFICRNFKVGDFNIGKDAIEELDAFMREFKFLVALARKYDPYDVVRITLRQVRKFNLPLSKQVQEEDVITDCLEIEH